ncbi:MAG: hypothetical protein AAF617_08035 [Bacteroidota bacterium]
MKKTVFFVAFLCAILSISCDNSDDSSNIQPLAIDDWVEILDNPAPDDFLVITANSSGAVFSIGNNSGDIQNIGNFTMESEQSLLWPQTIVATSETIYAVEYLFNGMQESNLLLYDIATNTTQSFPLVFPTTIEGPQRAIVGLAIDDASNLIGILDSEFNPSGSTKHLVNISLEDYSMTEIGISYTEDLITSMRKLGTNVYISTWADGLVVADLFTNTSTTVNSIVGTRLAQISATELAFMQVFPGPGGFRPAIIDVNSQTATPNDERAVIKIKDVFGGSVFVNQTYLNLVFTDDIYFGLLQTDFSEDKSTLTPINSEDVNRDMVIVTTIPVN